MQDETEILNRINLTKENYIHRISKILDNCYGIKNLDSVEVISKGFEDANFKILSDKKYYCLKIYAIDRTQSEISRNIEILEVLKKYSIKHPNIIKTSQNKLSFQHDELSGILMEFVDGSSFLDLDRAPNANELEQIIAEVTKLHSIDYKPAFIYDSWAVCNIADSYKLIKDLISNSDKLILEKVINNFANIDHSKLTHGFVHGDLIKSNVLLSKTNEIYLIDFSVANYYPMIHELAVICSSLIADKNENFDFDTNKNQILELYRLKSTLTDYDIQCFDIYILGCMAMELIGSLKERYLNNNIGNEVAYWEELGRANLTSNLAKLS